MKGKILLTIYSTKNTTYPEKLDFMKKLIGEYVFFTGEHDYLKKGFVHKFNNSYGYKDVQEEFIDGSYLPPKVDTPDSYHTPEYLLVTGATFLNKKNELMSFIIPGRRVLHPNRKYSYEPLDMVFDFQKFLYKIFPDIRIQFELKDENFKLPLKTFALGHFMTCFAYGEMCETEFSGDRLLKAKEIKYILDVIKQVVSFEPELTQFWCDTCYGYHKDYPYHIQIDRKYL